MEEDIKRKQNRQKGRYRAKRLAWESWSEELNSSEQQTEMFKIAKQMKRKKCNWSKVYKGWKRSYQNKGRRDTWGKEILLLRPVKQGKWT